MLAGHAHHIRGAVVGLASTDQGSITIHPEDEEQVFIAVGGANYKPNGSFDFANIDPGTYVLTYFQVSGERAKGARQLVAVGERDVNDVVLSITSSATIVGRIKVEGAPAGNSKPIDFQTLKLTLSDALVGPNAKATVQPDGRFVIRNIVPGRYVVRMDAPPGTYLKAARFGQTDARTQELDLAEGGSGELEVVYRYGLASVAGSVAGQATESAPARVVLIPAVLDSGGRGIVFGVGNTDHTFLLKDVAPGHYRAYAFESIDFAALQEPDILKALQSSGTDLEIAEGE
jgi:hypothetical protein